MIRDNRCHVKSALCLQNDLPGEGEPTTLSAMQIAWRSKVLVWVLPVGALAAAGCASSQSGPKAPGRMETAGNVPAPPSVDLSRCDPKGKRVQQIDGNSDGK